MKILVVSNLYPPQHVGGYELGCRDVVEKLRARGHNVRVLTSTFRNGKTSEITHSGLGVFAGLPSPLTATRYHSLVVRRDSVPDCLEITAEVADGTVMGLRHRELPVEGVQFHPESILTEGGHRLIENFLTRAR